MWPWSTLAKLRNQIAFEKSLAVTQRRSMDDVRRLLSNTLSEKRTAEAQRDEVQRAYDVLKKLLTERTTERDEAQAQLAIAVKNDTRDPKTGRFVKAAS
mgnify:CR=1 FL=1